jgi:hypothetical protein
MEQRLKFALLLFAVIIAVNEVVDGNDGNAME